MTKDALCSRLKDALNDMPNINSNPYEYEKWGKGRPTKMARFKRDMYIAWNWEHIGKYGLAGALMDALPTQTTLDSEGNILIKYEPRVTE